MTRLAHRLLARHLPPDVAEYVIGDLVERNVRGIRLWHETVTALWTMTDHSSSGEEYVSSFISDLRHAARLLRRSPAFTLVSILTLGLGVGATTAIFSVIHPVIIQPLPYPDPDRVVMVWERMPDGSRDNVGFLTYRDIVDQSKTILSAAAIGSWEPIIGSAAGPERVSGDRVSWNYFRTLGVRPALGRDFMLVEDEPGKNQQVILSHGLWARSFGGDSAIIGRTIPIGGNPMTVVGVMPLGYQNVISPRAQIWRVLGYTATQAWACRTCHHLRMVARIRDDVAPAAALAEIDAIHKRLEAAYPREYASNGATVVPVREEMTREFRPALLALTGAVVVMLLIAIANVASMLLARAVRRQDEFAVRTALGAGQSRLFRQLLTEGFLLALLGGIAGLAVAAIALPILISNLPPKLPRLGDIQLNTAAFGVVALLILGMSLIAGLAPANGRRLGDLAQTLRSGSRTSTGRQQVARSGLVVIEVALALMLLVGCGLLAKSMMGLLDVRPGFEPTQLLTMEINSVGSRYAEDAAVFAYHDRVRAAVEGLPGIIGVAVTNQIPMGGNVDMYAVHALDKPRDNPETTPSGDRYAVSIDYLKTMGIPVVGGRGFTPSDMIDTTNRVVLLSDALTKLLWPGENPIGKQVRLGGSDSPLRTVIGVTGNVRHRGLDAAVTRQAYIPERQWFFADNQEMLVIRTTGDPAARASSVRRVIREIDPTQPIVKVATMEQLISASTAQRRLALVLFVAFGGTALLLAIAGIYGVLAGRVAERTREIGLRSALGATPRDIVTLVVGQGVRLAIAGLALGLGGALALSRFLQSMLFGVGTNDPATLVLVVGLLLAVTIAACLVPAVRAVRVDPSGALRAE